MRLFLKFYLDIPDITLVLQDKTFRRIYIKKEPHAAVLPRGGLVSLKNR